MPTMSSSTDDFDFLETEDCVLTLNYAWYHTIGCASLLLYLYAVGQTQHFEAGHNFGVFAMLCDYGIMYLARGARTLVVLPYNGGEDCDDLYGIGTFLFFGWFDYLGGFALLIFARNVSDVLANGAITKTNVIVTLQHVLMWWTAPYFTVPNNKFSSSNNYNYNDDDDILLPPMLRIDDRTLVLSRSSPKSTYLVLFLVFTTLLWKTTNCTIRQYCAILASGLACGSLHHLALYFFGMRGYDSTMALVTTLATEWPALVCGEAYLRMANFGECSNNNNNNSTTEFSSGSNNHDYSRKGRFVLLTVLTAIMMANLPNVEQLTEFLISVIPGQHMQAVGTTVMWAKTCVEFPQALAVYRPQKQLECIAENDNDDSIWVLSTPAKSGAVLRYV